MSGTTVVDDKRKAVLDLVDTRGRLFWAHMEKSPGEDECNQPTKEARQDLNVNPNKERILIDRESKAE